MEAELRKAFERADLDKNGFLTKDEIRQALIEVQCLKITQKSQSVKNKNISKMTRIKQDNYL